MVPERASGLPSGQPPAGEPLIPILSVEEGLSDPVALATWYEALASAIGIDVPHDLLGLWLFPTSGGVVLLGPAALAEDRLAISSPLPYLQVAQLTALEDIVRRAGYDSAVALPIRFGRRDVGLLLAAAFQPDRFRDTERALLQWATQRLAPTLGRLARLWDTAQPAADHGARLAALLEALGVVSAEAKSPRRFAEALSHALESMVPHDHLELLIPAHAGDRWYRLGEHAGGRLWADPALIIDRTSLDVAALFGARDQLVIPDTYADRRWPRGYLTATEPAGAELRALVGARIGDASAPLAYLLLGSVGPDFYRDDDAVVLHQTAGVLRARIETFARVLPAVAPIPGPVPLAMASPSTPPTSASASTSPDARDRTAIRHPVATIVELLATVGDIREALALAAEEARLLLPFRTLHYALRLTDDDRVVLLDPGERRPLADLPLVPIAGTALGQVLHGASSHGLEAEPGNARLIVPLRVGGKVHGAVVFTAAASTVFNAAAVALAQQFADVLAPHLELLRRAALPPPYMPGWKRPVR